MRLALHPKQLAALGTQATEVLFGGGAGGGKSHLMRSAAISWCVAVPGLQVYLFRREYPDLKKNHFSGPGCFQVMLAEWIDSGFCQFNITDLSIRFSNGSAIYGCHCQHENDVFGYQGAEFHVLLMDELTHFTESQYRYLRSRCRCAGLALPTGCRWAFPRVLASSNPGGPGHTWVKDAWIDHRKPMACEKMSDEEGGMVRQFIPALLDDNPSLNAAEYSGKLKGIGDPALVKAMLSGDWNIVAGGMFDDVWDGVVRPTIQIPQAWRLSRSFDWGSSKPFSVCWWAEADGTAAANGWCPKRGSLIMAAEWYGFSGKPNEGLRMTANEIARGILEKEQAMGWTGKVKVGPADSAIFATENGNCIGDDFARCGVRWDAADKGPGSRANGWEAMRRMMRAAGKRPQEEAGLFILDSCRQAIRTIPALPRDRRKPDDIDTDAEDHIADAVRYRVFTGNQQAQVSTIRF